MPTLSGTYSKWTRYRPKAPNRHSRLIYIKDLSILNLIWRNLFIEQVLQIYRYALLCFGLHCFALIVAPWWKNKNKNKYLWTRAKRAIETFTHTRHKGKRQINIPIWPRDEKTYTRQNESIAIAPLPIFISYEWHLSHTTAIATGTVHQLQLYGQAFTAKWNDLQKHK